ncbi:hypothetical protein ABW16_14050 [Mycolicibacter heraklionensis]|uniref:Uncharacterized protein n=1 Tax=Mycolicibacter heraklionensis TaxID=512402 RepID=A0ABR5FDY3_9MYCO|nr:hypothetical protein [Mycolicibacter heraklionensis]KLO28063.1 hypothetical protein ABW16_14050 [Mycolicibacter heraklionensis]
MGTERRRGDRPDRRDPGLKGAAHRVAPANSWRSATAQLSEAIASARAWGDPADCVDDVDYRPAAADCVNDVDYRPADADSAADDDHDAVADADYAADDDHDAAADADSAATIHDCQSANDDTPARTAPEDL